MPLNNRFRFQESCFLQETRLLKETWPLQRICFLDRLKLPVLIVFLLLFSGFTLKSQNVVNRTLTMWTTGTHMLWDSTTVKFYGFGDGFLIAPEFPGPTIVVNEGDSVYLHIRNQSQGAPHTVHLHGLDVDQYNDGVPQTSWVIHHQETKTYAFLAKNAGTYLYHCHVASILHVQMGMYGNVIVQAANGAQTAWTGGPAYDRSYNWLMSEFDRSWHDTIPVHNTGDSVHAVFAVPPYQPDYFFVNGKSKQDLEDTTIAINGRANEDILLRLSNVGFLYNQVIFPSGVTASVISSDGRPLPVAYNADTLVIGPGERYGVMLSASQPFSGQIEVAYHNMNNQAKEAAEFVPITILNPIGLDATLEPNQHLTIWPNPAGDQVNFYLEQNILPNLNYTNTTGLNGKNNWKLDILDVSGRIILSTRLDFAPSGLGTLATHQIPAGLYLIRLQNGQARLNQKIVIAR